MEHNPWMNGSFEEEDLRLTQQDIIRIHTIQAGDPVGDYMGFPLVQHYIIAAEKAKARQARTAAVVIQAAAIFNTRGCLSALPCQE